MLLLAISTILLLIGITFKLIYDKLLYGSDKFGDYKGIIGEWQPYISIKIIKKITTILATISVIIIAFITSIVLIRNTEITKTSLDAKYSMLQLNKNNPYLIKDIIDWNEDLAYHKKYNNNIWIGILTPDYYAEYDYIIPNE